MILVVPNCTLFATGMPTGSGKSANGIGFWECVDFCKKYSRWIVTHYHIDKKMNRQGADWLHWRGVEHSDVPMQNEVGMGCEKGTA